MRYMKENKIEVVVECKEWKTQVERRTWNFDIQVEIVVTKDFSTALELYT